MCVNCTRYETRGDLRAKPYLFCPECGSPLSQEEKMFKAKRLTDCDVSARNPMEMRLAIGEFILGFKSLDELFEKYKGDICDEMVKMCNELGICLKCVLSKKLKRKVIFWVDVLGKEKELAYETILEELRKGIRKRLSFTINNKSTTKGGK